MGIEKDYLMRQIMLLFEAIQKILKLRKKGENQLALDEIRHFYDCLKIDGDISELNIEELIRFLVVEKKLANEQLELVAIVLKEQGELTEDKIRRLDFFRKAYFLMDKVERESTSFSIDRQMRLTELKKLLD